MNTAKRLNVDDLSCVRQHQPLFISLSFELCPFQVLLVEGPNGSGKSSLLRLLCGLSTSTQGTISWEGKSIQDLRAEYWNNLHYISHTNGIKLGLTVAENLQLTNYLSQTSTETTILDCLSVLERLQLHTNKNRLAKYLSAGQKKRLALAKLFLFPKPLWILDEPLTALDVATQTLFLSHLHHHLQAGGMAIISSHHPIHFSGATGRAPRSDLSPSVGPGPSVEIVVSTLRLGPC
jgi:heme exporter protein A